MKFDYRFLTFIAVNNVMFYFSGQVQLVGQSRMDEDSGSGGGLDQDYSSQNVALKAQVIDKYAFTNALPRHESIRDLLHLQSQQQQHSKFRPNEEWSPAPEGKVWYQINRPSFRRRRRRRAATTIARK